MQQATNATTTRKIFRFGILLLVILISVPFACSALLLALLLGYLLKTHRHRFLIMGMLALAGAGMIYLAYQETARSISMLLYSVGKSNPVELWVHALTVWGHTWPIAPMLVLLSEAFSSKDRSKQNHGDISGRHNHKRKQTMKRQSGDELEITRDANYIGRSISGDLPWIQNGSMIYPADILGRHVVAIGSSGSGKTETLLRLAYVAAKAYGWNIVFLDLKGSAATQSRFYAAMQAAGRQKIACYPQLAYNGWRGDPTALFNRLLAVQIFSEPYYEGIAQQMLDFAFKAPIGLPKNSREFLSRLRVDELTRLYAAYPDILDEIRGIKDADANGVFNRYRAFFRAVNGGLDGEWAFDDVEACYLLVNGTALQKQAESLGRFLLQDFAHYVSERKHTDQRILFIIDEYSAVSDTVDAANLFERVREFGGSVIVSTQSYSGLGATADKTLDAAGSLILHACADPEKLAARAGTRKQAETGYQISEGRTTGMATLRVQDTFKVRPDSVRQLTAGECYIISGGKAAKVRISRLDIDPKTVQHIQMSQNDLLSTRQGVSESHLMQEVQLEQQTPLTLDNQPVSAIAESPAIVVTQKPQDTSTDQPITQDF